MALLSSVFVVSLLGSQHCVAMCGGLVGFVSGNGRRTPIVVGAYQFGRWFGYATLGVVFGWVGKSVDALFELGGVADAASSIAAVLMIWWGASRLLVAIGIRRPARPLLRPKPNFGASGFTAAMHWAGRYSATRRALVLGLLTGLLPCGWLYAFVLTAAGTGDAFSGFLVMTAFWLGSVPALLGASALFEGAVHFFGRRAPTLAAVLLMVAGLGTLLTRQALAVPKGPPDGHPPDCPMHQGGGVPELDG
jgi:sulfite exporter TauE/SafE